MQWQYIEHQTTLKKGDVVVFESDYYTIVDLLFIEDSEGVEHVKYILSHLRNHTEIMVDKREVKFFI